MRLSPSVPCLTLPALAPGCAQAHAFGQRYDLPLPLDLYLWGAGVAVGLSFVLASLFLRAGTPASRPRAIDISDSHFARWLTSALVRRLLAFAGLFLFALVIASGLAGPPDPAKNFAPVFVWVIWWVGFAYVAAFIGNLWSLVNPWSALFGLLAVALPSLGRPLWRYPARLGFWPAVALLCTFAWLELISGLAQQPATLAWLVVAYSLLTLAGMRCFGRDAWLYHGELFTVLFGLMARFGLFHCDGRRVSLRLPGIGLAIAQPVSASLLAFTVLMLTTVSFDGFLETPFWSRLNGEIYRALAAPGSVLQSVAPAALQQGILVLALLLFYMLFLGAFLAVGALVYRLSASEGSASGAARAYVLSLVPIAIAYHLAHYFSYLMIAGQLVIPLLSDPFGRGWNLFGTAGYRVDISVFDAGDAWYLAVTAIVLGHIASVCIGHVIALRREPTPRAAVVTQLPLLALMVAYTMISLWILSQPITA